MKTTTILLLVLSCIFVSCDSNTYQQIDKVTGIAIFTENGNSAGLWNVPNDNSTEGVVFPNPSSGLVFLLSRVPVGRVWIVSADCSSSSNEDIRDLSADLVYAVSEIEDLSIRTFDLSGQMETQISLQDFAAGFYKVFYESLDGELYWQNIYIDPSRNVFPDLSILDEAC